MSSSDQPQREKAKRVLAAEFDDIEMMFKEAEGDMEPKYALLPTGQKANRVFFVGTLTEAENVGEEDEYWQGKVVGPTGNFMVYAGQYQEGPMKLLRGYAADPDAVAVYVAVVGKPRTYERDDGSISTSVQPESISPVNPQTRDSWIEDAATATLERIGEFNDNAGPLISKANEVYGDQVNLYAEAVLKALDEHSKAEAKPN